MPTPETSASPADILTAVNSGLPVLLAHNEFDADLKLRQMKARFWQLFYANPLMDVKDITPTVVEQTLGKSVRGHLSNPHFWSWFTTKDSAKQNLEVAAERASELAIYYLNPAVPLQDSARVNLIKIVLEYSGRTPPSRKEVVWQDKEVGSLTSEELDAFINKEVERRVKAAEKKEKAKEKLTTENSPSLPLAISPTVHRSNS